MEALEDGIPLIEIDYLHELPPIMTQLPSYPRQNDAHPYSIVVSDPRPDWYTGMVRVYGFDVDEPIKQFLLPLARKDAIIVDLDAVYQQTFQIIGLGNILKYAVEPARFDTYSVEDQAKIRAVMATIHNKTP